MENIKGRLNDEQIIKVISKFEYANEEQLQADYENGEVAVFNSYKQFFEWLHQECTTEQLVEMMFEGSNMVDETQIIHFDDDKVLFYFC